MSLPPPCFSVLKMYIQRLNYQVFPMKTSETFQVWTKCVKNKWEGNRVPLGERNRDCTLTKEPQNYSSYFVWYGVTIFKTQQLKPYKGQKHNICSFQKVHKHSLIQNELVSTFTLKISNCISFINHLYRNNEKSNIRNTLGCIFVLNGPYLWCKSSLLGWYSQFGNLTLWFALFRSHAIY